MDAKSPTSMANLTASFLETYEGSKNQASNRAFYESEGVEAEMIQVTQTIKYLNEATAKLKEQINNG